MFKDYTDIIMMGCDPEGGYNPVFEKNSPYYIGSLDTPNFGGHSTAAQPRGYDLDFAQSLKWAKHYNVNLRHINDVSEEEKKELGL